MRMNRLIYSYLLVLCCCWGTRAQQGYLILPMGEDNQNNHMKAYGITYQVLADKSEAYWLLNYDGGSFAIPNMEKYRRECVIRAVSYRTVSNSQFNAILDYISDQTRNMEAIKLEVAPKIAVYSPTLNARGQQIQPWDDAVTLVLTYAEIPYDLVYDDEVLEGRLSKYDWLHLHHEDFTGQFGKFYANYHNQAWYKEHERTMRELAEKHGYDKVSELKLAVVKKIREYVAGGGFMFAMCSATDTYEIALAADGVDICDHMYDGDPPDPNAQSKLNFENTFAFENFHLVRDPLKYEYSTIDASASTNPARRVKKDLDYFTLFEFSAKWDPVPVMLNQCHTKTVKGFMGQTTAFRKTYLKSNVLILGENKPESEARYIHGKFGNGTWTFYGGHDPEDYRHFVHDPPTDLNLHPKSPGYRLILNNVLFPAAKKKKRKT